MATEYAESLYKLAALATVCDTFKPLGEYNTYCFQSKVEFDSAVSDIKAAGQIVHEYEDSTWFNCDIEVGCIRIQLTVSKKAGCVYEQVGEEEVEDDVVVQPAVVEKKKVMKPLMGWVCK